MSSDLPAPREPTDDPAVQARVDRLVAEAYRVPVDELQVARLERAWQRERHSARVRGWAKSLAAAASIALLGTIVWGTIDRPAKLPVARQLPLPDLPREHQLVAEETPQEAARIVGQTPDRLREVLFTVRTSKRPDRSVSLSELLADRESLPPEEAQQELLAATGWRPAELRRRIVSELDELPAASQRLAVGVLAQEGSEAAVSVLQRIASRDALRPICLEYLFEMTDGRKPDVLLAAAQCHELSHWLLEGAADDPRRVACYLALVAHQATRHEALGALRGMAQPPISSLVAAIDSDQRQVRIAAALALGQLGGSEVAQPLIELVTGHNRRNAEAWLAIVSCDGPLAEEFLAHAARDPLLLGHYNAARFRQQQMSP